MKIKKFQQRSEVGNRRFLNFRKESAKFGVLVFFENHNMLLNRNLIINKNEKKHEKAEKTLKFLYLLEKQSFKSKLTKKTMVFACKFGKNR